MCSIIAWHDILSSIIGEAGLPDDVHGSATNRPWVKLVTLIIVEFVDTPIANHDRARGKPEQIIVFLRPYLADIQPLANEPMMFPKR